VLCCVLCHSDGLEYPFLAKPKDDLRKDYRLMDFAGTTNALLARTPGGGGGREYKQGVLGLRWGGGLTTTHCHYKPQVRRMHILLLLLLQGLVVVVWR
jgi:hypothetical protein